MGSRMMHLIIAGQVAGKIDISDRPRFLLGGIAPDAVHGREQKTKSHYYEGSVDDGTRRVHYEGFIEKYQKEIQDEFILGYVVHLVGDDVWMKDIYFKKDLKTASMPTHLYSKNGMRISESLTACSLTGLAAPGWNNNWHPPNFPGL